MKQITGITMRDHRAPRKSACEKSFNLNTPTNPTSSPSLSTSSNSPSSLPTSLTLSIASPAPTLRSRGRPRSSPIAKAAQIIKKECKVIRTQKRARDIENTLDRFARHEERLQQQIAIYAREAPLENCYIQDLPVNTTLDNLCPLCKENYWLQLRTSHSTDLS